MPRVLKIDSITHRPICKTAGAGGFSGHNYLCHSKARIGVTGQCKRCTIPFFESGVSIDKMVGCGNAVPCGSTRWGVTGWDFDLEFGTGSSYAATQTNLGDGLANDEWASVRLTLDHPAQRATVAPFTYKWSTGSTSADVNNLEANPAGTYSVTVSDKNGNSKTKEMPIIYTKMIAGDALLNYVGGVIVEMDGQVSQNMNAFPVSITLNTNANGVAAVIGGKPPYKLGLHCGLTDASRVDWESINAALYTGASVENGYITAAGIQNYPTAEPWKQKLQTDTNNLVLAQGTQQQDQTWEFMDGSVVGGGEFGGGSEWFVSINDSDGHSVYISIGLITG